jgi:acyl-CoA thioester hydrolase
MSKAYVYPLRVRFQECNAYGVVDSIHFLYYMQEAFMSHAAESGYTFESELAKGRGWLIRETKIQYLRPLRYWDTVDVEMRIGELRRASLVRNYEFRVQGSEDLVARAWSEFVCVDVEKQRPTPIPDDVIAVFFPDGRLATPSPRKRYPKAPPPPNKVFQIRERVEWRDLDMQRHVNNCTYMSYMQTAAVEFGAAIGWPGQEVLKRYVLAMSSSHVQYQGQAAIGDEIEISSYISDVGSSSLCRHDSISLLGNGATVTRGHSRWVWLDAESLKPRRIPAEFLADCDEYIVKPGAA